jgi:hypothetical protein
MSSKTETTQVQSWTPFLKVGLIWLILGGVLSFVFSKGQGHPWVSLRWMFFLWLLVVVDLIALASFVSAMFDWKAISDKNQGSLIIRASSWGVIKLACLGLLGMVLYSAKVIPSVPLFLGLGTLVVTPIGGGLRLSSD